MTRKNKGWKNEPTRHGLASKGVKTNLKSQGWMFGHNEGSFRNREIGLQPTGDLDKDDFKEIGEVRTLSDEYSIYRYDANLQSHYYLVNDIDKFIGHKNMSNQEISHFVDGILFLVGGESINLFDSEDFNGEFDNITLETENGLLEDAVDLGKGADGANQEILYDVEKLEYYDEIDDLGEGLTSGLGFPGGSYGIMVGKTFNGKDKIIMERVDSYPEGYVVMRKEIPPEMLDFIKTDEFEKVKDLIEE